MKTLFSFYAIVLLTGFGPANTAHAAEKDESKSGDSKIAPVYSVDTYDPKRTPAEDLAATVKKAKAEGRRILIQVGGDWCGWCKLMNKYFHQNEKVAAALARDFVIMKVHFSKENDNKEFLKKYPSAQGYPHLYVLESDGTFLHSQGTAALEEGKSYSEKVMLDFLAKWAPKKTGGGI